jgi:hypothetical protein
MDGAAPGRAASGRGVPIELSPTAGRALRDPGPQGRAQGHPKPVRGAARRPVPRAPAGARRRIETVRRTTTIDEPPTSHGVRPRSPRPRAKAVRRAAPLYTARRDGGASGVDFLGGHYMGRGAAL